MSGIIDDGYICRGCLQPFWQKGGPFEYCPNCSNRYTMKSLPNYQKTAADYYAEQQLAKLRAESQRQISDLHLSQEEIRNLRAQAEAMMADANTQQITRLRSEFYTEREKLSKEIAWLRESNATLVKEIEQHKLVEQRMAELEQQLARYQPDPNDSRDWTGDPFWAPPAVRAVVPATASEQALADETLMRSLEQPPGRLERFFDHRVTKAMIFAGGVAGLMIVDWLHH